jgi:hypothetical protein
MAIPSNISGSSPFVNYDIDADSRIKDVIEQGKDAVEAAKNARFKPKTEDSDYDVGLHTLTLRQRFSQKMSELADSISSIFSRIIGFFRDVFFSRPVVSDLDAVVRDHAMINTFRDEDEVEVGVETEDQIKEGLRQDDAEEQQEKAVQNNKGYRNLLDIVGLSQEEDPNQYFEGVDLDN